MLTGAVPRGRGLARRPAGADRHDQHRRAGGRGRVGAVPDRAASNGSPSSVRSSRAPAARPAGWRPSWAHRPPSTGTRQALTRPSDGRAAGAAPAGSPSTWRPASTSAWWSRTRADATDAARRPRPRRRPDGPAARRHRPARGRPRRGPAGRAGGPARRHPVRGHASPTTCTRSRPGRWLRRWRPPPPTRCGTRCPHGLDTRDRRARADALRRAAPADRAGPGARRRPAGAGAARPDHRRRRRHRAPDRRRRSTGYRAGRTTLLVTSSPALLARCDRVLLVVDGAVVPPRAATPSSSTTRRTGRRCCLTLTPPGSRPDDPAADRHHPPHLAGRAALLRDHPGLLAATLVTLLASGVAWSFVPAAARPDRRRRDRGHYGLAAVGPDRGRPAGRAAGAGAVHRRWAPCWWPAWASRCWPRCASAWCGGRWTRRWTTVERAGTGDLVQRTGGDIAVISEGLRSAIPAVVTALIDVAPDPGRADRAGLAPRAGRAGAAADLDPGHPLVPAHVRSALRR